MAPATPGNAWFYLATPGVFVLCVLLFRVVGYGPGAAVPYLRRNARWVALNALLIAAAVHALMLAPVPPDGTPCVDSRQVWGPMTMVVSCDSDVFAQMAREPQRLAIPGYFRQSRPLLIMAASSLTLAELPYGRHLPAEWFSYVILNFVVLLVALMLFLHLNTPAGTAAIVGHVALSTFLVFNDVVKGFFWSAHTQMWNVLTPLIAIALARALLQRPERSWRFMAATGALVGIGMLAYASLMICVPAAIVAIALGFWMRGQSPPLPIVMGKVALFVGAFALPSLVWIGTLLIKNGEYYSAEVQGCRYFIWLYDYWVAGGPIALEDAYCGSRLRTGWFLGEFFMHLQAVAWPGLVLFAVASAVAVTSPKQLKTILWERSHTLTAGVITLIMCLGFFLLMGFYRNRLEFNIVVPVIVMMSVIITGLLERMPSRQALGAVLLVAVAAGGCVTATLVLLGPYV